MQHHVRTWQLHIVHYYNIELICIHKTDNSLLQTYLDLKCDCSELCSYTQYHHTLAHVLVNCLFLNALSKLQIPLKPVAETYQILTQTD